VYNISSRYNILTGALSGTEEEAKVCERETRKRESDRMVDTKLEGEPKRVTGSLRREAILEERKRSERETEA
jgi:hypothetical protein